MCPRRVFKLKPTDFQGPEYEERIPRWMGTITEVVAEDMCFGCRICENQCPVGVIEVTEVKPVDKNNQLPVKASPIQLTKVTSVNQLTVVDIEQDNKLKSTDIVQQEA